MNNKKTLLILLLLYGILGCKKENSEIRSGIVIDTGMRFKVFNTKNEDLLAPSTSQGLNVSEIKLFYVVDNNEQYVFNANSDAPNGFVIHHNELGNWIGIGLNSIEAIKKPITIIQWNENNRDTIEVTFDRRNGSVEKNKVWLNGNLIWEKYKDATDKIYRIIK